MRYSLYLNIKKMFQTLIEATEFVNNSTNTEVNIQLLSDINYVIVSIEKVLLENKDSINSPNVFEELTHNKQMVMKIRESLEKGEDVNSDESRLLNDIKSLNTKYNNTVKVIYEIVFFAEIGQKWDSMNSVYEAFRRRENCNVKVVLTPIFRAVKKEQKVETKVIYEDYLTDLGINFIPYEQFNIEKELPDIAFISNPYEGVTLTQFWPENISKYTRLVYLPYYTGMVISDNSIQAHCGLPVANYAWRIIAQSWKIKKLHQEYSPRKGENVIVTGLPKWDSVHSTKINSLIEPSWNSKLVGKKTFLWNSHYDINSNSSTLLEYGKEIVNLFLGQDDIALIWRPHPMTDAILNLYLPQYKQFWEDLKDTVINSNNMILDTSHSYKVAFNYSDALISDWSSIVTQFLLTKKPILMLRKPDHNVKNLEKLIKIDQLEQASNILELELFINNIRAGIDKNKDERIRILNEDIIYTDGTIGENVCDILLNELKIEENIKMNN